MCSPNWIFNFPIQVTFVVDIFYFCENLVNFFFFFSVGGSIFNKANVAGFVKVGNYTIGAENNYKSYQQNNPVLKKETNNWKKKKKIK